MKRQINVTWTCSEQIEVEIEDGALTENQIAQAVRNAARDVLPGGGNACDEWDYDWLSQEPVVKGESSLPPDDYWFEAAGYTCASNGWAIIVKGCPVEFVNDSRWLKLGEDSIDRATSILSVDFSSYPPHTGWFRNAFKVFKGYRVVGKDNGSGAYVLDGAGKLIAYLMPRVTKAENSEDFQFKASPPC